MTGGGHRSPRRRPLKPLRRLTGTVAGGWHDAGSVARRVLARPRQGLGRLRRRLR